MKSITETAHKTFSDGLLIVLMIPFVFMNWLLFNGEFGAGKAMIFVIAMFLFGSFFFFN